MKNLRVFFLSEWLSNPYKDLLSKALKAKDIEVEEYRNNPDSLFFPSDIWKKRPDILHLHSFRSLVVSRDPFYIRTDPLYRWAKLLIFVGQLFALKLLGTKTVWTVHEWSDKFNFNKNDIPRHHTKIIGKFLDGVITHCDSTKQEIMQAFGLENQNKVFTIPHGNYIEMYDNNLSQLQAREILGIPSEQFVFLLLGNIYRYKGVLEAIDSFKRLQQNAISLVIAGQCHEKDLEESIQAKIKGCENILYSSQRVADEKVQVYMNASDCVLLPYQIFTTSGAAILAMSFARVCIAPSEGFFEDVLDDSGAILYDPNHEDGLLEAMNNAIAKKDQMLDMGKYNLKIVEQWSWDYVADETFNLYQRCLSD